MNSNRNRSSRDLAGTICLIYVLRYLVYVCGNSQHFLSTMFRYQNLYTRQYKNFCINVCCRFSRGLHQIKLGSLETHLKSRLSDLYCLGEHEIHDSLCDCNCLLVWDNERIKYCRNVVVMDSLEQSDSPSAVPRRFRHWLGCDRYGPPRTNEAYV
ncbi:hypothetical protein HanRHA438_Chr16g0770651 [Helianthus annuus]|nr:hypothetical protein HanRHA438_Chr16g0770651 [Helianthus annuus]